MYPDGAGGGNLRVLSAHLRRSKGVESRATVSGSSMQRRGLAAFAGAIGIGGIAAVFGSSAEYPWSRPGASAVTILDDPGWPPDFPLTTAHLKRLDESADTNFYSQPRFLHHVDEHAQKALQQYYMKMLPQGGSVLDLMSSWTSHLAPGAGAQREDGFFSRLAILGMNEAELKANPSRRPGMSCEGGGGTG